MLANRESEIQQYQNAYKSPNYKMGVRRKRDAASIVKALGGGSLLDIGTGRGELLKIAQGFGFNPVAGTEVVEYLVGGHVFYAQAHDLPFADESYDHVTCFDVMEHLIEDDLKPALEQMFRVAKKTVTVSASEVPSIFQGRDLHISSRPAAQWLAMMKECWGPNAKQICSAGRSPCFQVVKNG